MRISPANGGTTSHKSGLLTRLRRDTRGNTLAMMAMATIPLAGMVGSAVDIGRGYLIKSRLQQACDAGVLAARRSMASNIMDPVAVLQGNRFFGVNFAPDTAGTTSSGFTLSNSASGEVSGVATAVVPMTITRVFGTNAVNLTVNCASRLEIPNTDVMFVLDTTGSMNDCPDNSTCNGGPTSKIAGIRAAVMDFYDTMATSIPVGAQLRYGFVPYSSTVNVGDSLLSSWLPDNYNYRSRVANFNTVVYLGTAGTPAVTTETYGSALTSSQCNSYGSNLNYPTSSSSSQTTGTAPANTTQTSVTFQNWGGSGSGTGTCRRTKTVTVTSYVTKYRFTNWSYSSVSLPTNSFKAGSAVVVATGTPANTDYSDTSRSYNVLELAALPTYSGTTLDTRWGGCIEERDTVANATFSYGTIPSNAYDLDLDAVPSSNATMWRPWWPEVVWSSSFRPYDNAGNGYAACPAAARRMGAMTRSDVQSYVNTLVAIGGTYHDVGMIWGARMISPTGIFAADNATAPNGQPITRNIIFMTDGQMAPNQSIYGLYGMEAVDQRVSGGNFSDLTNRHNSRFRAMCDAARAKNIRIWVVGFGTSLSSDMTACADPGQAFQASNTATLRAQFAQIASQVARLRLSQ
jgi:Flp pilus assembly protein TadG